MPFLDRLEMAAMSGWSRAMVYEVVRELEDEGLTAPVPHATDLTPLTARYHLTAEGVRRLAREEATPLDDLLRFRPVSLQWRAVMLKRLDAVAVVYRLASAVSEVAHPTWFQWYRALPLDAAIELSDGRTVAIARWGRTQDRTAFSKRMRRLLEGPLPGGVLLLVSDVVRLRHARRLLSGAPVPVFLAVESDAAGAGPDDSIWSLHASGTALDLRTALHKIRPGSDLTEEPPLSRLSLPWDMPTGSPGDDLPDHALPSILKSAEKKALDLLSDWPWITLKNLAALLNVSESRASRIVSALEDFCVVARLASGSRTRLVLTDRGLGVLAHRDRSSLSIAKKRWSSEHIDPEAPLEWRNVSGSRSRQLLRNVEHTGGVHAFVAALAEQSRALEWGDRAARPAAPGFEVFFVMKAVCAPSSPMPSQSSGEAGPYGRSSWGGSDAPCDPQPWRPASLPTCATTPHTGPPARTARGAGRVEPDGRRASPMGLPPRTPGERRAARTRMAHARRIRTHPTPRLRARREVFLRHVASRITRSMRNTRNRQVKKLAETTAAGSRPTRHASTLGQARHAEPFPEMARSKDRRQPGIPLRARRGGTRSLRTHPTADAEGARSRGLPRAVHLGGTP